VVLVSHALGGDRGGREKSPDHQKKKKTENKIERYKRERGPKRKRDRKEEKKGEPTSQQHDRGKLLGAFRKRQQTHKNQRLRNLKESPWEGHKGAWNRM